MPQFLIVEFNKAFAQKLTADLSVFGTARALTSWAEVAEIIQTESVTKHWIINNQLGTHPTLELLKANHLYKTLLYYGSAFNDTTDLVEHLSEEDADSIKHRLQAQVLKNMDGPTIYKSLVITYNHHFRNKLAIIQGAATKQNSEMIIKQINHLVELLKAMEQHQITLASYSKNSEDLFFEPKAKP